MTINTSFEKYEVKLNPPRDLENYNIDNSLAQDFESIFEKLKGEPRTIRSNSGKVHLPYIIDFKANQKNLKVFKKKLNTNEGNIILLIDGSGSMRFDKEFREKGDFGFKESRADILRDMIANLYKGIEEISRINLKCYIYGGSFEDPNVLAITEINDLKDCKKITYDGNYYGSTPTHTAIDYVNKQNQNLKGKTLFMTFTDGHPVLYQNHRQQNQTTEPLRIESRKALVNSESLNFNTFGVGINLNRNQEDFKTMFRDNYVNVDSKQEIKKIMVDKLTEFVGRIR